MDEEVSHQYDEVAKESPSEGGAFEDKPIMMLFKRLIGNENKQNTVLTNAQIMDILEKEFYIDTNELHELEMDIYLSIMKKFLKDWPQWDDFDGAINELKLKNDHTETQKMLLEKYHHLKHYLSIMLDTARPRAKEKVQEVEEKFNKKQEIEQKPVEEDLSDVVLEIYCSRTQINTLFYRHPHPKQSYTIFNVTEAGPSKICLDVPDYDAILNWWNVNIIFKINTLHFIRSTVHEVTHTLVNNKLNIKTKASKLKSGYQEKYNLQVRLSDFMELEKVKFASLLQTIYKTHSPAEFKPILEVLYAVFEKDLSGLPNILQETVSYRKYFCRHPYVRYLCTEVPEAKNDKEAMNYDLHLREVVSPMYQFNLTKIEPILKTGVQSIDFKGIHLECSSCSLKFLGQTMLEQLKQHILENHLNEPDWICTKCQESFTMVELAKNRWFHDCKK